MMRRTCPLPVTPAQAGIRLSAPPEMAPRLGGDNAAAARVTIPGFVRWAGGIAAQRAAAGLALLAVAACGPLVQIGGNDKAPASLLALRATAVPAAGAPALTTTDPRATVLVLVPAVPGILQTLRLPVTTTDTTVAYLTGATWAEQPNREFQRVLADTIAARGIPVLDPRQATAAGGRTLSGTLLDFGLDVRDPAAAVVRVRFDAALTGPGSGVGAKGAPSPFAIRRFDASVPVATQNPTDVAIALNTAANAVAADVAAWIPRQ